MTEAWFRNPDNYIREMVEVGANMIAWDMGYLVKRRLEPIQFAKLYYGESPWRTLLIGTQGSIEIDNEHTLANPLGVYPTWEYGERFELLEEMIAQPAGDDPSCYDDTTVPVQERPVKGQPHRVVVTEIPDLRTGPGRYLIRRIKELQEEYPQCLIHIHGIYSYRIAFGMGFGAADMDSRTKAAKGTVVLPNGKEVIAEKTIGFPQWVTLLGMLPAQLKVPRNRCMYNIKSAMWAGKNWDGAINFKSTATPVAQLDTVSNVSLLPVPTTKSHLSVPVQPQPGDRQVCDTCSLQDKCKYYRQGAVCTVPGSEPARLATMFKSRDADQIIDGLSTLLAANANRLEKGVEEEQAYGELDPEVTKIANQLFNQGVQLAKLIDPNLRGGAKVQVNVGGDAQVITTSSPKQIMGSIVRELERRGIPRAEITPEMVSGLLAEMATGKPQHEAIEGTVLGSRAD